MESTRKSTAKPAKDVKTKEHATRYFFVGVVVTIFNYILYAILANLIIKNNNLIWLSSLIATVITTIVAYIAHSKITWKERQVTKTSVIRFFIWNAMIAIIISPTLTQLFSLLTPLYNFAYSITTAIHLPFTYEFVLTTGAFALTSIVIMILNFLFYDRFVFPKYVSIETSAQNKSLLNAKVSIIIPIYNTSEYLPTCLNSVLAQSHKNLEIILVDDGSTDESAKIADRYAQKDSRIKVIHQKNQGQSSARNVGIQKATGKFISFIDSDDSIKPDFISNLLAPYNAINVSLTVCGIHYKRLKSESAKDVYISSMRPRQQNESSKAYILRLLALDGRMYSSVNKLFLSKVAKTITFDKKLNFAEDTKYVLDYLNKAKGEISFVLKPLYIYNFGTSTSTIKTTSTEWVNWQTSYNNLKTWLGPHPTIIERFWLYVVHSRWIISFTRSVKRAKK